MGSSHLDPSMLGEIQVHDFMDFMDLKHKEQIERWWTAGCFEGWA